MPLINDYLLNPNQRVYWLYLACAALLAWLWLRYSPAATPPKPRHAWRHYWLHPSALLDYRYFVLAWLIKLYLLAPLLLSAQTVAAAVLRGCSHWHPPLLLAWPAATIALCYTLLLFVAGEFSRYWLHRWLHTVPWLWAFHKVHHSAEVLNPLSFYRVHPLENALFGLRYALVTGVVSGGCLWLFGARLNLWLIGGAHATVAVFALAGGNLRHSHIYLCYPAWLERWLMSPAQHQLHHSPAYSRCNYGGYLSMFDACFGTLKTSNGIRRPSVFGFPEAVAQRYRSLGALLWQPWRDCLLLWRKHHVNTALAPQYRPVRRQPAGSGFVADARHRTGPARRQG